MNNPRGALVVLSGGQDSTTCLALAQHHHPFDPLHAITFNYGQLHAREIAAAAAVAALCGVASFEIINLGAGILESTSPLVNRSTALEQYRDHAEMEAIIGDRVEKTFVPMRNALFLTIAANRAIARGCDLIYTGVCQADNANYPDCRDSFIESQRRTINEALGLEEMRAGSLRLDAPLIFDTKADSIRRMSNKFDVLWLLAFTHTAYDGQYPPLGHDHATTLRAEGFVQAGVPDPLIVRAVEEGLMELPLSPNYGGVWEWHGEAMSELRKRIQYGKDALTVYASDPNLGPVQRTLIAQHLGLDRGGKCWVGAALDTAPLETGDQE